MVKSGTQYPYVRTAYDGVCWPGVLCRSADTPTGKMRIKNADNICGLMGKMQICGRIEIKAFA